MEIKENVIKDYIKDIYAIDSPTGFTKTIINHLHEVAANFGYKTEITQQGNLYVHVEGQNHDKHVGVAAHTDTLGLMVRSIKSNGALAFTKIGGPILPTLDGEYCKIYTRDGKVYTGTILSTSPAVHVHKDANTAARSEETMEVRLDEVVKGKEDVLKLGIQTGDYICYDPKTTITESGYIKTRFIDDKMSVVTIFALLDEYAKTKTKPYYDTTFIITVYEEVGHGLSYLPSYISEVLALDMGCIGLDLNCTEQDVSICVKDSSGPYDYDMITKLADLAKAHNLSYALDVYPFYSSDVSTAIRSSNNIRGALIGTGVYASHGMERTHIDGVKNTLALTDLYLQSK